MIRPCGDLRESCDQDGVMLIFPDDIADPPLCARAILPKVRARLAAKVAEPVHAA